MEIAAPWFAALALPIFGLVILVFAGYRRTRTQDQFFAREHLLPRLMIGSGWHRRWLGPTLLLGTLMSLTVALAQPQWGEDTDDAPPRGRDIVVLLDTSMSMLAEDVAPNRLERAKQMIRELVAELRRSGGHRLALIGFAGRASLRCPPTLDYDLFLLRLDELTVGSVPQQGTLIGDAVRQTLDGFAGIDEAYADIILITDGEDHNSLPMDAAREAAGRAVAIHTVGVGDAGDGAYVPIPDPRSGPTLLAYHGRQVKSRMQPDMLKDFATETGGHALLAGTGAADVTTIYRDHIADKPRARRGDSDQEERRAHRFQWFVAFALLLLFVDVTRRVRMRRDHS